MFKHILFKHIKTKVVVAKTLKGFNNELKIGFNISFYSSLFSEL